MSIQVDSLSIHVRFDSQAVVAEALARLGVVRLPGLPVSPPRPLPPGVFVSPVRQGWVSLWSTSEALREWLPHLTMTLECSGVLLQVIESRLWFAEFYWAGQLVGRVKLPTEAVRHDALWLLTADSLEAEGLAQPWQDEARFDARMQEIARSPEFARHLRTIEEERPHPDALRRFLPPHARVEVASELLTAIDRDYRPEFEETGEVLYAEDYAEQFAGYLGIHDATWDPRPDWEFLAAGDYEEEDMDFPEGWRDFILLPLVQLPVLESDPSV